MTLFGAICATIVQLSHGQIAHIVKDGKANTTMPALPSGTSDQQLNELVDFVASLK
jgi:hypothetical protein